MDFVQELIYYTKYIPNTKFNVLSKIIPFLVEPILDLGCHIGDTFYYMKFKGYIVGIDVHSDYFSKCIERGIYQDLIELNLKDLPISRARFGCVTAFFVLEHLEKRDGLILLDKMEKLGENNVVVVPLGHRSQESVDGNTFQKHLSSWFVKDFLDRGFQVKVCWALTIKRVLPYRLILGVRKNEED